MSNMNADTRSKNQPFPFVFGNLIRALDDALKARAMRLHNVEIVFQTSTDYSDHRWSADEAVRSSVSEAMG
jgi:hypothetical protein